jgi:hypothetical protein
MRWRCWWKERVEGVHVVRWLLLAAEGGVQRARSVGHTLTTIGGFAIECVLAVQGWLASKQLRSSA